jgi:hypothetical protein
MTDALYQQVTQITEEYLGPAAERFVTRQITFHLNKQPQELLPDDIPKLVEWTRVTFGLLTEDQRVVDEYTHKLQRLANK